MVEKKLGNIEEYIKNHPSDNHQEHFHIFSSMIFSVHSTPKGLYTNLLVVYRRIWVVE